jgi:HEAT repeat protein
MKTWRAFVLSVLIAALVGIILMLSAREPRYHGRSLTSWLQQCSDTALMETQRLAEAQAAVGAIGAKRALPILLHLVEAKDDPASTWIIKLSEEWKIQFLRWHSAEEFQEFGFTGFDALGTNAAPAIEELTKLLNDKEHAFTVVRCLVAIGTSAEASVSEALTNENRQVRYFATQQFAWVTDDDKVFLAKMQDCLKDPDATVRFIAIQGIGAQTQAPEEAVPLLISILEKNDGNVSSQAAGALANFGTNAMSAFHALTNAVERENFDATAGAALRTLAAIAPKEALPVVFNSFNSTNFHRRNRALQLLCGYPITNSDILPAIEMAAKDPNPQTAQYAQNYLTKQYEKDHPDDLLSDFPGKAGAQSYGGKPLGEWLKMYDRQGDYSYSKEATNAIHHIGTNAIPELLERLVYVQPPFGLRAVEVNMDAMRGFITLGEQALPALPKLQTLMDGTNQDFALYAMMSACGTGSNAIPILLKGLTNQFANVRGEAASALTSSDLGAQFPELRKQAIPFLVKLLNDPDQHVRMNATNELKELDPATAVKAGIK